MVNLLQSIIYNPLYNLLMFFVWLTPSHSVGWAIVLLTLLIRIILLPSSLKAAKAQARLQMLQPQINKIRSEIKNQQEQAKAIMDFYKKEGVSPFGSCLPQLIQLPILFVLYQVFRSGLDMSRFSLLYSFVPHPSNVNTIFYGIDLSKPELWFLPILAGLTQYFLTTMMMTAPKSSAANSDPAAAMMKQMMYIMPLFTVFVARSLPAALSVYWVVTTLFSIAQQWYVNKHIKEQKAEIQQEGDMIEQEIVEQTLEDHAAAEKPKKKDFMSRVMDNKLKKQEKKTGVNITIRKKE